MKLLVALLIILNVSVASAQEKALTVLNVSLAGVDLAQTIHGKNHGFKELNPLYTSSTPATILLKTAATTSILVLIYKLTKPKSKQRYAGLITYAVVQSIVVAHNQKTLSQK